jgi:hypothetical protein
MAEDEEDIDIDIDVDIDGDEPEDRTLEAEKESSRTEGRDTPTTIRANPMGNISDNVDDTMDHKEDTPKRNVGIGSLNTDNMK